MSQQQFIISPEEPIRTFDNDEKLPNLPVPSLEHTVQRYLESVKPFAETEEELLQTKKIAEDFLVGVGSVLQTKLLKHAAKHRNWVERWWEDYAYLSLREPLIPYCNMSGSHPPVPGVRYGPGQQIKMASAFCYQLVRLWQLLRQERLRPTVTGDKRPLAMDQFRKLFNCSIIPGLSKDTINANFKTEREGLCSSQVVVLSGGHMFVVEGMWPDGQPLSPMEWDHQLTLIQQRAATHRGQDLPCLTCDYRTPWAQNRQHLVNVDTVNSALLSTVESAMFVLSLDAASPSSESEVTHLMLCGDYTCRWPNAATNVVVFNNGLSGGLCVHSAFDGIVSGVATLFACSGVEECADKWIGPAGPQTLPEPQQLDFVLDPHILAEIDRVKMDQETEKKKFIICREEFYLFGKRRIQNTKVHPDAFIQMALQLAFYRLHSRFAPCYETATTRAFYRGRTETVRSCTQDCVLWVQAMVDPTVKEPVRARLLLRAVQKHHELMSEACSGSGFDRHLLALYCLAVESDMPVPQLYLDPLFEKSGGGGNFLLSTSLLGYAALGGGVAPMCLHGYGIFYSITPDSLLFTISVRRDSLETSTNKLFVAISCALQDMMSLLETQASAKL